MSLGYSNRIVALSRASQAAMRKRGETTHGDKLWTDAEVNVLRELYPDYDSMRKSLPHRTRIAILCHCRKIGLKKSHHRWLAVEISKLRKIYPSSSNISICAQFPGMTWINIQKAARYHGIRRKPRTHRRTGNAIMDAILSRIEVIGWTLRELDEEAGTGNYFQNSSWRTSRLNFNAIAKAVRALDGNLEISWKQYA